MRATLFLAALLIGSGALGAEVDPKRSKIAAAYGKVPLHFEPNAGQHDEAVRFAARGRGYQLFLARKEAVLALHAVDDSSGELARTAVLRMGFEGANADPRIEGERELPGKSHYLAGPDRSKWRRNVAHYGAVRYQGVYPGIDLLYYGNQAQLEYDWVVAPGADPGRIVLAFDGANRLSVDADGDLLIATQGGTVRQRKPVLYQEIEGERAEIDGRYMILERNRVGFRVGPYDPSHPLVIDPVLLYSTYLGGSGVDAVGPSIAVNAAGEVLLLGTTASCDFPKVALDHGTCSTSPSAPVPFITKLNSAGDAIVFSTQLGHGVLTDIGLTGAAFGPDGAVYLSGSAWPDAVTFPATRVIGPAGTGRSAAVFKLSADGSDLVYSTYIRSSTGAAAGRLKVDSAGSVYTYGSTGGTDFPVTPGAFQTENPAGIGRPYVIKLTPDGQQLEYATLFGSPNDNTLPTTITGIDVDAAGQAHIVGVTQSLNLPLASPAQLSRRGLQDGFFTKFNASGSELIYSSYYGGTSTDGFTAVAVGGDGNAYITGRSDSTNFPMVNALPTGTFTNSQSIPVVMVSPSGSVIFSTPLGTHGIGSAIAVDSAGRFSVAGVTDPDFPSVGDLGLAGDSSDAFVAQFAPGGSALLFAGRIGGIGGDQANAIAVDNAGGIYLAGGTASPLFPVASAVFPVYGGAGDGFVLKIFDEQEPITLSASPNPATFGQPVTLTALVAGTQPTGIVTFRDGSTVLGAPGVGVNGVTRLTVPTLPAGTRSISASYSGDSNHAPATATLSLVVNSVALPTTTALTASASTFPANQSVVLTATVTGTASSTPTGTVNFFDGITIVGAAGVQSGVAVLAANLPGGVRSVTAQYGGDALNKPSTSAPVLLTVLGPPTTNISAPANASVFDYPATVNLTAAATSPAGATVTEVTLLLNGAPLATIATPPYVFAWANAPPGVYTVTARAVDNFGQTSVSAPILVQIRIPGVTYYHHDLQGNVVATTNSAAQVVYTETYQPYGGRLVGDTASQVAQPDGNRLWFHGKAEDQSTGLQYFGARYYDPVVGRFMGVDPVGFSENNIHSFNRYGYGNNNPYRYIDRDGRLADKIVLGTLVLGVGAAITYTANPELARRIYRELKNAVFNEAANSNETDGKGAQGEKNGGKSGGANGENTNPYRGPVDKPVIVVDPSGNAIPVAEGEQITTSPNGDYQQVRDRDGNQTGVRLDRGGHRNRADPRERGPHGHVPGVTTPEGNDHLPIKPPSE
jgi:RHS repeat-associated protein